MTPHPNPEEAALHAIDRALAAGDPWQRQWFFAEALELHRQAREARQATNVAEAPRSWRPPDNDDDKDGRGRR